METVYDWVTVGIFAALVVLFVQRSTADEEPAKHDSLLHYLAAALGCAIADYLGNQGYPFLAVPLIAATIFFIVYYLRPFKAWPRA
jgi:hypothetical protein